MGQLQAVLAVGEEHGARAPKRAPYFHALEAIVKCSFLLDWPIAL